MELIVGFQDMESNAKVCVANTLISMTESVISGFNRLQIEEHLSKLDALQTSLAILISDGDNTLGDVEALLLCYDKSLSKWCEIKGRGSDKQTLRRVVLRELREWYVSWCANRPITSQSARLDTRDVSPGVPPSVGGQVMGSDLRRRFSQIIKSCSIKDLPGAYIVGCFDHKKTVHTQQRRAVALINSLIEFKELKPGQNVGIVGGGFGGLAAAVAAFNAGAHVMLYEKQSELVPIQRGNTQRYIHPNIYEWPRDGSLENSSKLPFLNWSAGIVADVVASAVKEFKATCTSEAQLGATLGYRCNSDISEVKAISQHSGSERLAIVSADSEINELFDVVIIAVGFGLEDAQSSVSLGSLYWENDSLGQPIGFTKENPERILVSGTGDGALIDCVRAVIRDFVHGNMLADIPLLQDKSLQAKLIECEIRAENFRQANPNISFDYFNEYKQIFLPYDCQNVFGNKIYEERIVHLNHRSPEVFSYNSSVLNRAIVFLLYLCGHVRFKRGHVYPSALSRDEDKLIPIRWRNTDPPERYHNVVIRHGANAEFISTILPDIWNYVSIEHPVKREFEFTSDLKDELVFYSIRNKIN